MRGSDEVQRAAVVASRAAVLKDRQEDLRVGLVYAAAVVVGHEKMFVNGAQRVSGVDCLLRILSRLRPLWRTGVHLGIQIEAGQEQPSRRLIGATVGVGARILHGLRRLEEFLFDELKQLRTLHLRRLFGRDGRHERHLAVEVDQVVVVQGADEARFGPLGDALGVRLPLGLLEEEVAERDVKIEAIVEARD